MTDNMIGPGGVPVVADGGNNWTQVTQAAVIKAIPGRLCKITVIAPGSTGGTFTFNDCKTTGAAASGNQVFNIAYNAATNVAGNIWALDWPCLNGIVCSAVPTGGSPIINVSWA